MADRITAWGWINRSHLREAFGISTQQASIDLQAFLRLYPGQMVYDLTSKRYRSVGAIKP